MNTPKKEWVIWSNEHAAWWKPYERGYTYVFQEAGLYTEDEVKRILEKANIVEYGKGIPNEVALLIADTAVYYK
jgi:hypothetical protein